jgi:hypothetical protein
MFIFGVTMTTRLERLQRGLAIVEAEPGGKDSLYAQDLKGQIAAAKWTMDQQKLSPSQIDETYFGGTMKEPTQGSPDSQGSASPDPMQSAVDGLEKVLAEMGNKKG